VHAAARLDQLGAQEVPEAGDLQRADDRATGGQHAEPDVPLTGTPVGGRERRQAGGVQEGHLVEVEDYAAMRHALADDPVNVAWQQQMSELLEVADDYSGDDRGIPLVWSLP